MGDRYWPKYDLSDELREDLYGYLDSWIQGSDYRGQSSVLKTKLAESLQGAKSTQPWKYVFFDFACRKMLPKAIPLSIDLPGGISFEQLPPYSGDEFALWNNAADVAAQVWGPALDGVEALKCGLRYIDSEKDQQTYVSIETSIEKLTYLYKSLMKVQAGPDCWEEIIHEVGLVIAMNGHEALEGLVSDICEMVTSQE